MNTVRIKYSASFLLNLPVLKVFCKVKVCKVISLLIFQNSLSYINNVKKSMVKWNDRYPSLANLNEVEDVNPLRRAYSENHLGSTAANDDQPSVLSVNTNRTNVGEKVVVSWNLNAAPSQEDWLGLFYADGKVFL